MIGYETRCAFITTSINMPPWGITLLIVTIWKEGMKK